MAKAIIARNPAEIFRGVIYSRFEKIGPKAIAWYPEFAPDVKQLTALKTLNILAGDRGEIPDVEDANMILAGIEDYEDYESDY